MPIKKVGKKWQVKNKEYDTEDEAIKAYQAYLNAAMGIEVETTKKPAKQAAKRVEKEDEE